VLERLLGIKIEAEIVDTLALSWYLYPELPKHGLTHWGERLGIAKPVVEDWEKADLQTYTHRCEEDVKINHKLWLIMSDRLDILYNGKPDRLIKYLSHKMNCAAMQEVSKWKLDVDKASSLLEELNEKYKIAVDALATVMPQVPKIAKRSRPAKPFKKDGTLSATGEKWQLLM
jgi:DNA polymerase III alpha subunit (gram-positive type)